MKVLSSIAILLASMSVVHAQSVNVPAPPAPRAEAARQDPVQNDPVEQRMQREREEAESSAVVKRTKEIHGWDSAVGQKFMDAIKYRRYRWADFDQVVFKSTVMPTDDMIGLMSESPYAADIAYYLGKHPLEAASIAQMPLTQSGPAIRAIELKVKPASPTPSQ